MQKKGVLNLENDKVLINSAMLTAIWDETKKDNIELLSPFVLFLIGKTTDKEQQIDCLKIIKLMEEDFSFIDFPHAVLIKVFNRLKNKRIIEKNNGNYFLIKNIRRDCDSFINKQDIIKYESDLVISSLLDYIRSISNKYKELSYIEVKKLFIKFLEQNGLIAIQDVKELDDITKYKRNEMNYLIGKFILLEYEKDSYVFNCIYKITSGFMLANTIYMQVENNNNESLKKLTCYLDGPLILNVLGFKTKEQNDSGKLLMKLLLEKKASVKCFRHTFNEVYSIISGYKENLNVFRTRTLEGIDLLQYTKSQVELIILSNLEKLFRNAHIEIVDKPDFLEYSNVIDERGLTEHIEQKYIYKEDDIEKVNRIIENDVDSISSISRLRGTDTYNRIESCKFIFITTNYYLIQYTDEFFKRKKFEEVGYAISDTDLITVLWLKTFRDNPDLPKMKLIENARLSIDPSNSMMEKFKDTLYKIKEQGIINDVDILENIQTDNFFKTELMEQTFGNEENINEELVEGIISKSNRILEEEKASITNEKQSLEVRLTLEEEKKKYFEEETKKANKIISDLREKEQKECKVEAQNRMKNYKLCIKGVILFCLTILGIVLGYALIVDFDLKEEIIKNIAISIMLVFNMAGIIMTIIPKYNIFSRYIDKWFVSLENKRYLKNLENKKKEKPELFNKDNLSKLLV